LLIHTTEKVCKPPESPWIPRRFMAPRSKHNFRAIDWHLAEFSRWSGTDW